MNVVDSSGWLAYFADEPAADFFAEAIEDAELLVVPAVCVYEVFKVVLRERGEDAAFTAAAAMHAGIVVDLDGDLALEAAALGLEEGLAFADSVIYAVARRHNAVLWTQDIHFKGKTGVRYTPRGGPENG
jgi:predicted nucleic acid-binding protein